MNKPKKLLIDIETVPHKVYTWGKYDQDVIAFIEYSSLLSVAWKWADEKKVYSMKRNGSSDRGLVKKIWNLFDEADIIIAHNGVAFDTKRCMAAFSRYGMKPPSPFKQVDTKLVAKKHFSFPSNSLNDIADFLGIGRKKETGGFDLWLKCMAGDRKAWKTMLEYNENDVILLEKIYLRLLPYITEHPNLGMLLGEVCPKCGSNKLQARGVAVTLTGEFQRFQCQNCGGWGRFLKRERAIKTLRSI